MPGTIINGQLKTLPVHKYYPIGIGSSFESRPCPSTWVPSEVWTQWLPERIQKYSHLPQPYICLSHVSDPSQTNSDGGSSDLDDGELDQPLNLQPSEPTPLDPSELKKAAAT